MSAAAGRLRTERPGVRPSLQLCVPAPPAYLSPGGLVPIRLPASAGGEPPPSAAAGDDCATVASASGADVATSPKRRGRAQGTKHEVTVDSLSGDDLAQSSSGSADCEESSSALELLPGYSAAYSPPPPPSASALLALSSPNSATPTPPPPWELPGAYKGAPSPTSVSSVSASPCGRPPPSPKAALPLPKKKKNKAAQLKRLSSEKDVPRLEPASAS